MAACIVRHLRVMSGFEHGDVSKTPFNGCIGHFSIPARHLLYIYRNNKSLMKGTYLGEFEEVVLLAVAILAGDAYGASITNEIEQQMGRSVNLGAVHAALHRLEEKGLLSSRLGGATAERGGRSKRFFTVTMTGTKALDNIRDIRNRMWSAIPKPA
jgi:PadR family transcriptional regulator, regulatory protein PadR